MTGSSRAASSARAIPAFFAAAATISSMLPSRVRTLPVVARGALTAARNSLGVRLAAGEVRQLRYLVGRGVRGLHGKPQPPRARLQLGAVLADHLQVVDHQLDEGLLAHADLRAGGGRQ